MGHVSLFALSFIGWFEHYDYRKPESAKIGFDADERCFVIQKLVAKIRKILDPERNIKMTRSFLNNAKLVLNVIQSNY